MADDVAKKIAWLKKELAKERKNGNRANVRVIERDIAVLKAVKKR